MYKNNTALPNQYTDSKLNYIPSSICDSFQPDLLLCSARCSLPNALLISRLVNALTGWFDGATEQGRSSFASLYIYLFLERLRLDLFK